MTADMRVGEAVAVELRALGVDVVFGIPGVHTIELYRGLARAGIRAVTPRHEQGAGFMADGYARVSGRPGVCLLITGPGVTNALTPVAQAWHDSMPVLVVASTTERRFLGRRRGPLHDLPDQAGLLRALGVWSETVLEPAAAPVALRRAWVALRDGRPRPAHVAIPYDVLSEPGAPSGRGAVAVPRRLPAPEAVARAAAVLGEARRPAILLGGGAADAGREAAAVAERLGAPVALTGNAKGAVPASHPLVLGATLPFAPVRALLDEADAVLLVGTELSEVETLYSGGELTFSGRVVRVDVDPRQIDSGVVADVGVVADGGAALAALAEALGPGSGGDGAARVAAARAALDWTEQSRGHFPWLDALDAALPEDRIVALDSTQLAYTAQHYLPAARPRSWLAPYGLGTLGPALPMAIGAKIAAPDRPVVAIAGDAGLLFTVAELATAVDLGLSLPVVVWDNAGYGEIRDAFDRAGAPRLGVDVTVHDVLAVAAGFGCATAAARTPDDLAAAVRTALATDGPTVIRCVAGADYQTSPSRQSQVSSPRRSSSHPTGRT
jgi:thiamine pyrophosphate-dependent acetolactate synthase large subunit-like protein